MTLPNFLIVGVARSGTTSLYNYIKQHPDIGFPKIKEPKYFSSLHQKFPHNGIGDVHVDSEIIRKWCDYKDLFVGLKGYKRIGEASSDYFYFHNFTIKEIKNKLGDIPIIVSLRNPVDRAYSAYNNLLRDGREFLGFMDALKQEEQRILKNWDWMWAYKQGGLYFEALQNFKATFSNVKIIFFDDFMNDPLGVVRDIFCFLNISEDQEINVSTTYSNSGKPKNKIISLLTNREKPLSYAFRKLILNLMPRQALEHIAEKILIKDLIPKDAAIYLLEYYEKEIDRLESFFDKDLNHWRKSEYIDI